MSHYYPLFHLSVQKILIKRIDGAFPYLVTISATVSLQNGFSFCLSVLDAFSHELFLDFDDQAVIEHVNLTLHGDLRVLENIPLYRFPVHQKNQVKGIDLLSYGTVVDTVFPVS